MLKRNRVQLHLFQNQQDSKTQVLRKTVEALPETSDEKAELIQTDAKISD